MEFHGIQKIGTLRKISEWKSMESGQQMSANKKFKKSFKYLGGCLLFYIFAQLTAFFYNIFDKYWI